VIHSAKAARRTPSSQESQISGPPAARARVEFSVALFPLTLALSLGERENLGLLVGESGTVEDLLGLSPILPLPAGEGWGEGEWGVGVAPGPLISATYVERSGFGPGTAARPAGCINWPGRFTSPFASRYTGLVPLAGRKLPSGLKSLAAA